MQEETLDAENSRFALGGSTAFPLAQMRRDLAQELSDELAANKVEIAETKAGKSPRPVSLVRN